MSCDELIHTSHDYEMLWEIDAKIYFELLDFYLSMELDLFSDYGIDTRRYSA